MEKIQPSDQGLGHPGDMGSEAAHLPIDSGLTVGDREAGIVFHAHRVGNGRLAFLVFVLLAVLALLVALVVVPAMSERGNDSSGPIGGSDAAAQTQVEAGSAPAASEESVVAPSQEAEAGGPLSGTWSMWWTNTRGDESVGFTIRFVGVDTGTVEIVNDETETDTSFAVDGDNVSFRFTRLVGDRKVPEESKWEGTFNSSGEIEGAWSREEWSCEPPPGDCTIGPGFSDGFKSRLVREG